MVPALISGACTIIAVCISGWFNNRGVRRVETLATDTKHLVNSSAQTAQIRNDQLVNALTDAGVQVPEHKPDDHE
jgi:hypothetical protein